MTSAYDAKANQHRPRPFDELSTEVVRLYGTGLQPRDISTALRLNLAIVISILGKRDRAEADSPERVAPKPWLPPRSITMRDRAFMARKLAASGMPADVIAQKLRLALPDVLEAIRHTEAP